MELSVTMSESPSVSSLSDHRVHELQKKTTWSLLPVAGTARDLFTARLMEASDSKTRLALCGIHATSGLRCLGEQKVELCQFRSLFARDIFQIPRDEDVAPIRAAAEFGVERIAALTFL